VKDEPLPPSPEQLLSPTSAAQIAQRSVRTIRRAYASGELTAFRDGGGRCVRIRYRDLREWMMSEELSPAQPARGADRLALVRAARQAGSA
jgi:excisionase family DNA binding protein